MRPRCDCAGCTIKEAVLARSYLSTGAITVAILSLGAEGASRVILGVVALVLVATLLWAERRDRLVAERCQRID